MPLAGSSGRVWRVFPGSGPWWEEWVSAMASYCVPEKAGMTVWGQEGR